MQVVQDSRGTRHIALEPLLHPTFEAVCQALGMDETVYTVPPYVAPPKLPATEI